MATESPIRFLEGTDKWSLPLKQSSRYRPSPSSKIAIELELIIGQSLQNIDLDGIPSRSESAPPSMEGSVVTIENILSLRESTLNPGSTDRGLPAHKEESEEDDRSSERSSSVDKAALLDHQSGSLDSAQEVADSHSPHIPSFGTSIASMNAHKSADGKKVLSLKIDVPSYTSTAVVSDVESSHLEAVQVVNTSNSSSSETHEFQRKDQQLIPPTYVLQQEANPHGFNTPRVQGSYAQIIYPGFSHPYGTTNQFYYGSSSAPMAALVTSPNQYYPSMQQPGFFTPQYSMGGYTFSTSALPPSYVGGYSYPPHGAIPVAVNSGSFSLSGISDGGSVHAYDMHNVQKFYGQVGFPMQPSADPFQLQYVQQGLRHPYGSYAYFGHQPSRDDASPSSGSPLDSNSSNSHKPHNVTADSPTNLDFRRGNTANHSPAGSDYPRGRFHRTYGNQRQNWNNLNSYSFLEELKSGKSQRFELSDITGYIGEFSVDQHGSRFIQQKLESCNIEDKASVFKEVIPLASKLMTDVFGNYVIQKLFEYGSPEQRKDLADQLEGQILPLSLQMYGCRVIQKALDVIDLDQKTRLVRELDGHVTTCVCDQNGNHVIQKCIESIPSDNINFVISSFRGQVATLSMHPYGCRVIQRVLEHCKNGSHTQFIVDEILDSVCSLAQHQYGNYVTQHVLERGKPHERKKIIEKLSRSIVQLSQHKFASNVVEKCLEYSDSAARDILLKEIIGDGNKNDNLWIMMKDQYANYVIQKILQKCSHDQREMLLGQIKNHLTALKKYTYGKHIVARFEELYGEEIQSIGS